MESNIKNDPAESRKKVKHKLVIGNLNTNSPSNKFEHLKTIFINKVPVLVLTGTNFD